MPTGADSGAEVARMCKVCGEAQPLSRFRDGTVHGRPVVRFTCRQCENRVNHLRRKAGPGGSGAVVVIGDTHFPFELESAVSAVVEAVRRLRPSLVVQVGDLYDRYSQSRFPRNHSVMTPAEEMERGREKADFMWHRIREAAPKARCVQLLGNHDERPFKRVAAAAPELMEMITPTLRGLHTFDGVTTLMDAAEEFIHDGVAYMHGYHSRLGFHATKNATSTVHGHTHHGGTWFRSDTRGVIFELDAGCLVDVSHKAFDYRLQRKLDGITVGYGVIDGWGPRFVPLVVP